MGYQESWLVLHPTDFDNALSAFIKTVESGYYNHAGAEPSSVIALKQPFGDLPEGTRIIWICGDRCYHHVDGIFNRNLRCSMRIIPIEEIMDGPDDPRLKGIDFNSVLPTENDYMVRFDAESYTRRQIEMRERHAPLIQTEGAEGEVTQDRIQRKMFDAAIRSAKAAKKITPAADKKKGKPR